MIHYATVPNSYDPALIILNNIMHDCTEMTIQYFVKNV